MVESAFDERYYRTRHGLGTEGTFAHFVAEGDRAGLDPCPYFSTRYYRTRYPDWQARGARTAVEDFLARIEAGDVRQPHPLIDPAYYVSRYPDLPTWVRGPFCIFLRWVMARFVHPRPRSMPCSISVAILRWNSVIRFVTSSRKASVSACCPCLGRVPVKHRRNRSCG